MAADEGGNENWGEAVKDLVNNGDVVGAIFLLESVVSKLQSKAAFSPEAATDLQLAAALSELSNLYLSKGLSLKADELRSLSVLIRARVLNPEPQIPGDADTLREKAMQLQGTGYASSSNQHEEEDDDWEAIADLEASLSGTSLFAQPVEGKISDHSNVDQPSASLRRRGRGSFLYKKNELYSDLVDAGGCIEHGSFFEDEDASLHCLEDEFGNKRYGTSHVILLYDFLPTTQTSHLENLFVKFKDAGFAIKWVSDTVALVVFRTPSTAQNALSSVEFPFKARRLEENDIEPLKIFRRDLEPPLVRPKTSARTAQRLISHAMGIEPISSPASDEFRKQEAARKNRILERQSKRSDAWGPD